MYPVLGLPNPAKSRPSFSELACLKFCFFINNSYVVYKVELKKLIIKTYVYMPVKYRKLLYKPEKEMKKAHD